MKLYLQNVTRFIEGEKTGYRAVYSNGLDFIEKDYLIKDGKEIINIPSIINSH